MIEKIATDVEVTPSTSDLAKKFNEVIDVLNNQVKLMSPRVQQPGPAQAVQYLEMMSERLRTGPYKSLSEFESNALTEAIGETLSKFQEAIKTYKESLVGATKTKATLEV
jgi:hypothetical protein